jgi:nucleoside-diphosphate-sugar epimerase
MKILVTGAAGFLGSVLTERLLARGEKDIRVLIRPGPKRAKLEALAGRYPDARLEFVTGNLISAQDCAQAVAAVDVVYHLAAAMSGAAADMFLHSVVASKYLLEAIAAQPRPIRTVLVSSFSVYGVASLGRRARVDENTPLEPHPERRDLYAQAKLRQEKLFWEYSEKHRIPVTVLRPGVIYGPGAKPFSNRIGLNLFGFFLHLGGGNALPLTYVENCAEAIIVAGLKPEAEGQVYNVVDDDLPTCSQFLKTYRREVERLRVIRLPYFATMMMSRAVEWYHHKSKGQLPAVFTPYKTASMWGGNTFSNAKLKSLGWKPHVATRDAIAHALKSYKATLSA